jgi:hypothetical protein
MFRRIRNTLLLVVALLSMVPVKPAEPSRITSAALLPAGFYWTVAGIIYTTGLFWVMVRDMACMDCTFRGHGAGGDF